jgi:glycosyltransferase involved in cell wall biosynthesis
MSEPVGGEHGRPDAVAAGPVSGAAPPRGGAAPRYSVVIPIHNEEECLTGEVSEVVGELETRGIDYELLLAENGSSDDCPAIADALAQGNPRIRVLHVAAPDYGAAMKAGMLAGRGDLIVNFDIDFHDVGFMLAAGDLIAATGAGAVVGSKLMEGAEDRRSPARHLVSRSFTAILRLLFDPRMDDTHGMKVLRREVVERYAPQTVRTRDLFDTELIIRARRGRVTVMALPVTVEEKRKPRSSIVRRIPRTMWGLAQLRLILWREGNAGS